MTQRERFLSFMSFQKVDRVPLMEVGIWDDTFERWHHEGLPKWVTCLQHLEDYLGLDRSWNMNWLPIDDGIRPAFQPRVLEETAEEEVIRDAHGVTLRQRKHMRSIPQYIRFPVQTMADYDELRPRLDGADPARYEPDFDEDLRCRRARGEIVGLSFPAFFGFPRDIMGLESWCAAFYEQPELVERIIADRVRFFKDLYARVLATRALDFVQVWVDMAYKTASLLSPAMVRRYMLPAYEDIVSCMRAGGVRLIMVDCDGHVGELLPLWRQAGVDGTHPCEIAAGSDPFLLRRACPGVPLSGGMDKRILSRGCDGVDAELARVMPLVKEGAFIPSLDHFVPPDMPWETYCYYVERRRELLATAGG
jgi:hypothetical protein